jgi:hypothetical protein
VQRTGNIILPVRCTSEHIIATIATNMTAALRLANQEGLINDTISMDFALVADFALTTSH